MKRKKERNQLEKSDEGYSAFFSVVSFSCGTLLGRLRRVANETSRGSVSLLAFACLSLVAREHCFFLFSSCQSSPTLLPHAYSLWTYPCRDALTSDDHGNAFSRKVKREKRGYLGELTTKVLHAPVGKGYEIIRVTRGMSI